MGADQNIDWRAIAESTLEWWRDAGVDMVIDEAPRNWLTPVARPAAAPAPLAVAEPAALPETLEEFAAWRNGVGAPESGWAGKPISAQGSPNADLMILVDLPDREDADSGVLMSGAVGRLFDRMLAAIGRDRSSVYLAAVCQSRPPAGRVTAEVEARLGDLARHHIALAAPKRLLLLGNAPSRSILGMDVVKARGGLHAVNLIIGTMPVATQAVASFHPRFLLERPAAKADAWKDLQMLIRDLTA